MKQVLVIGSNGFLGSELTRTLHAQQVSVEGVYHQHQDRTLAAITQHPMRDGLPKASYDVVFITAAFIPRSANPGDTERLYQANVRLVEQVCQTYINARIVYCSSVSVYGVTNEIISEATPPAPIHAYGISKLWGEQLVREHTSHAIVRISSLFGKDMYAKTFLPAIIKSAIDKKSIVLFGDGSRQQNYISVERVVQFLIKAAQLPTNEILLAADDRSYSNLEVAQYVQEEIEGSLIAFEGEDTSPSFNYDATMSKQLLGLQAKSDTITAIKALIQWMKK